VRRRFLDAPHRALSGRRRVRGVNTSPSRSLPPTVLLSTTATQRDTRAAHGQAGTVAGPPHTSRFER
jgi:hypothetical protein